MHVVVKSITDHHCLGRFDANVGQNRMEESNIRFLHVEIAGDSGVRKVLEDSKLLQRVADGARRIAGRSVTKLMRQVEAWHEQLGEEGYVAFRTWPPCGVSGWAFDDQTPELG